MFNTIMRCIILFLICFDISESKLWSKGVVHYAVNPKDYDIHSQDEIISTFSALEKEICVKFFNIPFNYNTSSTEMILYISNPGKQKNCPPQSYNYTGSVVNMPIGYKCINKTEIARIAMEMLKASITATAAPINSFDLVKRFEEREQAKTRPTFLSTADRNFVNAHYHGECSMLSQRANDASARRVFGLGDGGPKLGEDNLAWYRDKVWPLGVVMYSVDEKLHNSRDYKALKHAMATIELATCVVFHEISDDTDGPKNMLVFMDPCPDDQPELGFKEGKNYVSLHGMTNGDPGHTAHTLNNLLRALGIPMMSNRYDRDNYVGVHWAFVIRGRERLLEKVSRDAWIQGIPYDFYSATHAPANYLCWNCPPGVTTVRPLQDMFWQRTLKMGHTDKLSDSDLIQIDLVYGEQCYARKRSIAG